MHWNGNVDILTKFWSLTTQGGVIWATYGTINDEISWNGWHFRFYGSWTEIHYQDQSSLPRSKMANQTTGKDVDTAIMFTLPIWFLDVGPVFLHDLFYHKLNFISISFQCESIDHLIATTFWTWHGSTAVVPCSKYCSDRFVAGLAGFFHLVEETGLNPGLNRTGRNRFLPPEVEETGKNWKKVWNAWLSKY